jgi:signal recognition particle receptor subunit beta
MVSINYSAREVCCKIVYYGPGLSGKTTNLQYIHSKVPQDTRGKLISLATEADRTLYFDFLPINIGTINDFQAKFQLYTVPGQVYYNATRKLVLRGVDGLVFVADSQPDKMDENIESLANLEENLREYGYDPTQLPMVIQYNKRDLPGVLPVADLEARLNQVGRPSFEASATVGNGVFDTLKLIIKLVLDRAKSTSATAMTPANGTVKPNPAAPPKDTPYPEVERVPAESKAPGAPPTPSSNPSPEPVGVTASTPAPPEADAHPQPSPEPAPRSSASAARPYPGSEARAAGRKTSPAGFGGKPDEMSADSLEKNVTPDSSDKPGRSSAVNTPQMAPSLRRRGTKKKRGFFKRLFGVK